LYSWTITIFKRDKTVLIVKALKPTNLINRHQANLYEHNVHNSLFTTETIIMELKEHHTGQLNNCSELTQHCCRLD
jgi:hypothetical protein